ncbi:MAG: hypothetical protein KDC00_13235, partial [Flavobacteriales bacterium]|nr:hypothetical protein [Flavobacteriales bacterium]
MQGLLLKTLHRSKLSHVRKLLIILLFFSTTYHGLSQNTFSVVYHNQNMLAGSGRSVFELGDGYLLFSVQTSWDSSVAAVFATKFDLQGEFIWEKEHRRTRNIDPGLIDPFVSNGNGTYSCALSDFAIGSEPDSLFLYSFNSEGDTTSTLLVNVAGAEGVRDLTATADGNYLICGVCTLSETPYQEIACLRKVDASGNQLWRRTWSSVRYILNAIPTSDGGYLLGAADFLYPDWGAIIKVDELGNQQWMKFLGGNAETSPSQPVELSTGEFLVPAAWQSTDTVHSYQDQYSSLYRYSPSGELLSRFDLQYGNRAGAVLIRPDLEGGYWLCTGIYETARDPDLATTIWRLNSAGDTLYKNRYWYYGGYAATNAATYGMTPTSDGGLILTGLAKQGINSDQPLLGSTWLLKLDQYGCLTPGCQSVGVNDL